MSLPAVAPHTAEMSARIQQLLLGQGGRYASRVDERTWKAMTVLFELPGGAAASSSADDEGVLPAGHYALLPWDVGDARLLDSYLSQLRTRQPRLQHAILISSGMPIPDAALASLAERHRVALAVVHARELTAYGASEVALPLREAIRTKRWRQAPNPLTHISGHGDPRNPAIFADRLRHAVRRAHVTRALLTVNIGIYIAMLAVDGFGSLLQGFRISTLMAWGANSEAATVGAGEAWRLMTCTFLHAHVLHIALNMWALRVLGETAERLFGSAMFAAIYALSALGGSIASLAFSLSGMPDVPSVGASGAIFGLMGGILGFALTRAKMMPDGLAKRMRSSATFFIVLNVGIGLSIAEVDNAAHIGGLITGVVGGALLSRDLPPAPQPPPQRRAGVIVGMLLLLVGCYVFGVADRL